MVGHGMDAAQAALLGHLDGGVMEAEQAARMRYLWLSVLLEQWEIALGGGTYVKDMDRADALRWIGGRQFRAVCDLAGVDAGFAERRFRAQLAAQGDSARAGCRRGRGRGAGAGSGSGAGGCKTANLRRVTRGGGGA